MKNRGTIGANLSAARKKSGLSQEELALRLNVTRQTISNWESGRSQPDIEMLKQLAAALSVPAERLIYGEDLPGQRPARRQNPVGRLCRWLAWTVYILGALAGPGWLPHFSFRNSTFWFPDLSCCNDPWPVWAAALITGSVLLALSEIIRLLEKRE